MYYFTKVLKNTEPTRRNVKIGSKTKIMTMEKLNKLFLLLCLATASTLFSQQTKTTVQTTQTATAQTPMKTNTRGETSISGSNKPLWVLNGVILEDTIDLKPEDLVSDDAKMLIASAIPGLTAESIDSFRILKDASATAIYGQRAIGGVVVITTKRGSTGSSNITYTNESTFRFIPTYGQYNIMNSQNQAILYKEFIENGHFKVDDYYAQSGLIYKMYKLYRELDANGNAIVPNTDAGRNAYLREAALRNTNWFNELFQTNIMQNHTLSFTSGNEKSTYYAALSMLNDPGWTKGSTLQQYAGNLNANYNLSKKLRLNIINDLSYREERDPEKDLYNYALGYSRTLDPKAYYTYRHTPYNIFNEIDNAYRNKYISNVRLQAQLTWKINAKLEAAMMGAVRYQTLIRNTERTENSNEAMSYREMSTDVIRSNNTYLYKDPNDPFALPISVLPEGGIRSKRETSTFTNNFRTTLRYNDSFKNGMHALTMLAGFEMDNTKRHVDENEDYGVLYNSGNHSYYSYLFFKKRQEENKGYYAINNTVNNNQALFGNMSYTFLKRYSFNGTLRYDASNKFAESRYIRWMPTWNTGVSWNVTNESFFPKLKPLSHLSFKASFGITAISPSITNSLSQIYTDIPWRNSNERETALYIKNAANHDLTYEKNQELNLGTQFGLFNNRINVSAEWFNRNSYDLIGDITTQGVGGVVTKKGNMAEMRIQGLEFGLETTNIKTADFSWKTSFIHSRATNKITKLLTAPTIKDMTGYSTSNGSVGFAKEGYPLNSLFSVPFNGLNEKGLPTFIGADGNPTMSGISFDSRNVDFLKYSGTLIPTDKGSLSNSFTYKGLSLGVVFTYSYGNVVRLSKIINAYVTEYGSAPREVNNRWLKEGDEKITNMPRTFTSYMLEQYQRDPLVRAYSTYDYTDIRIAKGDNIRLKEISIGYTFDKDFLKRNHLRQLSIKVQGTNLALLYADKKLNGDDPDYLATGTPIQPKRLIFTLRVGL